MTVFRCTHRMSLVTGLRAASVDQRTGRL